MLTLLRSDVELVMRVLTEVALPFRVSAPVINRLSAQMSGK